MYRRNANVKCMCKYIYIYICMWRARMVIRKDVARGATGLRCRVIKASICAYKISPRCADVDMFEERS